MMVVSVVTMVRVGKKMKVITRVLMVDVWKE